MTKCSCVANEGLPYVLGRGAGRRRAAPRTASAAPAHPIPPCPPFSATLPRLLVPGRRPSSRPGWGGAAALVTPHDVGPPADGHSTSGTTATPPRVPRSVQEEIGSEWHTPSALRLGHAVPPFGGSPNGSSIAPYDRSTTGMAVTGVQLGLDTRARPAPHKRVPTPGQSAALAPPRARPLRPAQADCQWPGARWIHGRLRTPELPGRLLPATRGWFTGAFSRAPAARRARGRPSRRGSDVLVVAPTGSGKTLAAFLAALDRLASTPPAAPTPASAAASCTSPPLKALAVDVERNLRSPLTGIRQASGPPRACPSRRSRSASAPATPRPPSAAPLSDAAAGHPDHHPGVAVPDADVRPARRADAASRR